MLNCDFLQKWKNNSKTIVTSQVRFASFLDRFFTYIFQAGPEKENNLKNIWVFYTLNFEPKEMLVIKDPKTNQMKAYH